MPAPVVTLQDIVNDVKISLGYIDDGVSDPLLEQHIIGSANIAQRQLEVEHPWCRLRRAYSMSVVGGQRFADLPSEASLGTLERVLFTDSRGDVKPLIAGIDPTLEDDSGVPYRYDITPSTGVVSVTVVAGGSGYSNNGVVAVSGGTRASDGCDPQFQLVTGSGIITSVTVLGTGAGWSSAPTLTPSVGTLATLTAVLGPVQVFEMFPVPDAGTVSLEYRAGASSMVNQTDAISIDRQALVGRVAWLVASSPSRRMANTNELLAAHNAYLGKASVKQRPSNGFSLMRNVAVSTRNLFRNL